MEMLVSRAWLNLAVVCQRFDAASRSIIGLVEGYQIAGELPQVGSIGEAVFIVYGEPGTYRLSWRGVTPSGQYTAEIDPMPVVIPPGQTQARGKGPALIEITEYGQWWLEFVLDGVLSARYPILITPLLADTNPTTTH